MKQHLTKNSDRNWHGTCRRPLGPNIMTDQEQQTIITTALAKKRGKSGHIKYLCAALHCDKNVATQVMKSIEAGEGLNFELLTKNTDAIVNMDTYTYNAETDVYIVPLKTYGNNFVISGAQHRALISSYTKWTHGKDRSREEIGMIYKMTPDMVKEYMKIFKVTRDGIPVTREELIDGDPSKVVERVYKTKKLAFDQELQHLEWKRIQEEAKEWRALKSGELDPFERLLTYYKPEPFKPVKYKNDKTRSSEVFVIGLSDLHFGGLARSSELFAGQDFDAQKIKEIIDQYAVKIADEIDSRKLQFNRAVVCSLGDILHTLTGFTVKGVPLEADVLREEQFELALDCLTRFLNRMLELFGKLEVHAVKGNHAGAGDYILLRTLMAHFRTDHRITFNLYKARQACFRIGSTAILMDHGASESVKSVIPTNGQGKEAYIQSLFLQYPNVLPGAKAKLMLQGDRHRFMYEELRGFDHVIMGSCVVGDRYADQLGLHSRARQNCLVLSDDGLKEVLSFYFD